MTMCTVDKAELPDPALFPLRPRTSVSTENAEADPSENKEMDTSQTMEAEPALDTLTYVTFPEMNPLEVHGWDSKTVFENISPTQKALWESVLYPKILAYKAYRGRITELEEVTQLHEAIKKALEMLAHPLITPLALAFGKQRKDTPLYCALIGDLTEAQPRALLKRQFITTAENTTIFLEFSPSPTSFVMTLKGFFFLDTSLSQSKVDVNEIVTSTLFKGGNISKTAMRVRRFVVAY